MAVLGRSSYLEVLALLWGFLFALMAAYYLTRVVCRSFARGLEHVRVMWWVRRHMARMVGSSPLRDLCGDVKFDETGPYVEVADLPFTRIRLTAEHWSLANTAPRSAPGQYGKEALIQNNPLRTISELPPGGVFLSMSNSMDDVVGVGTRIDVGGVSVMFTAAHVMAQLRKAPLDLAPETSKTGETERYGTVLGPHLINHATGRCLPLSGKWGASAWSPPSELDFAGIEVPAFVWSALGVKAAKLAVGAPGEFSSVSVYGISRGELCSSMGGARVGRDPFSIEHYASSQRGWSGSPLVGKGGKVVGIHRGANPGGESNHGVILGPLVSASESFNRLASVKEVETWDDDWDTHEVMSNGRRKVIRSKRGHFAVERSSPWIPSSGRYWADMVDSDEEPDPTMESGPIRRGREPIPEFWSTEEEVRNWSSRTRLGRALSDDEPDPLPSSRSTSSDKIGSDSGKAAGSRQTGGSGAKPMRARAALSPKPPAATSGQVSPQASSLGGRSAAARPSPSSPRTSAKSKTAGQPSSVSSGRAGVPKQNSRASSAKQPKRAVSSGTTQSTLRALQKRVDGVLARLRAGGNSAQQISSEERQAMASLLRELLAFSMRSVALQK